MSKKKPYIFVKKDSITYFKVDDAIVGYFCYLCPSNDFNPNLAPFPYFAVFIPTEQFFFAEEDVICKSYLFQSFQTYMADISKELGDRNF